MQLMTIQDIRNLLSETGHALAVEDFELVFELDKAADVVVNGMKDKSESVFAYPLVCGGEAFYAPTIGKQMYWQEHIADQIDELWMTCAFLWLISRPEVPSERGGDILKAIKRWARKCKLTGDDIERIIKAYNNDNGENGDASYGEIIALLVREYGKDCNHWLNAPEHEITMLLSDWTRRQEAKAAEYRRSKVGSKNPLPPLPSPKIKAMRHYREQLNKLRATWQKSE